MAAFVSGPLVTRDAALFTDLYELTMAASYFREGTCAHRTAIPFDRAGAWSTSRARSKLRSRRPR
ncbi:MAG: hypothetical protein HYU51_08170 [Candidatus Rokubacteria bacterium]|nr:hypothetical protein [Candidatus Rokubacteria bacterium]